MVLGIVSSCKNNTPQNKKTNNDSKQAPIEKVSSATTKATKPMSPTANKKIKVEEKKPDMSTPMIPKPKKEKIESIVHKNPVTLKLQKIASRKKEEIVEYFDKLKVIIDNLTDEELPRKPKPKRTRVVVKVPSGNQPGDTITFANPHVPGQKLKVKVPVNIKAGASWFFRATRTAAELVLRESE